MRCRRVAVLGAGNMRCCPAVTACLAVWTPDSPVEIHLYDSNEERLDLADRLMRETMDRTTTEHTVFSTSDLLEALAGATDVVVSLHEDCARRMGGLAPPPLYVPEEPGLAPHQVRGDPNKPTHPDQLSPMTQSILALPLDTTTSREEALARAMTKVAASVTGSPRVLNLTRGCPYPGPNSRDLEWPPPESESVLAMVPHRILRWLHGDESLNAVLESARAWPLHEWLEEPDRRGVLP